MNRLTLAIFGLSLCLAFAGCEVQSANEGPPDIVLSPDERLASAINQGDVEQAIEALQEGADPNFVRKMSEAENDEFSPLQRAATRGELEVARALLANGADVNQVTGGTTPLHVAITMLKAEGAGIDRDQQVALIRLLIDKGANVNALNRLDLTPVDMAEGDAEVVAMLQSHGGMSTAAIQDSKLREIENQGGGLISGIPDSVEDLKRQEGDRLGEDDSPPDVDEPTAPDNDTEVKQP